MLNLHLKKYYYTIYYIIFVPSPIDNELCRGAPPNGLEMPNDMGGKECMVLMFQAPYFLTTSKFIHYVN